MAEIGIATMDDACAVSDLLRRSILEGCVKDHRNDPAILAKWLGNKKPEIVGSWFAWPSHFPLVARIDDEIVGVAMLARPGKIALLHVDPGRRCTGIGSGLLNIMEQRAEKFGATRLRLASTYSAQGFYERKGYQATGTTSVPYGVAVAMVKILPAGRHAASSPCGCR